MFNWSEVHLYRSNFLQNPYFSSNVIYVFAITYYENYVIKIILLIHTSLDLLYFFPSAVIHYINEHVMKIKCSLLLFVFWIILLRKKDSRTQFFQPNHNAIQSWTQHADTHNAYHLFCSSHRHLLQWIIIIPIIRMSITDRVSTNKVKSQEPFLYVDILNLMYNVVELCWFCK